MDTKNIIKRFEDHERRILALEGKNLNTKTINSATKGRQKQITIAELIKGKEFRSGQEKIAVIVGYHERIARKSSTGEVELKEGWRAGKFDGKYNPNFLSRAIKVGWVRNIDNNLDLSQSGEKFFDNFLSQNDRKNKK